MPRFKLLSGKHAERGGGAVKHYSPGEIVDSPEPLDVLFVNKFERLPDKVVKAPVVEQVPEPEEEETPTENPLGTEVTSQFSAAKDTRFTVFKNSKGYFVVDGDKPQNEKPLKKTEVATFLKELKEEEEPKE